MRGVHAQGAGRQGSGVQGEDREDLKPKVKVKRQKVKVKS
jgi:hypothetical protein